jgi:pyruvate,water dikinase
VYEAEIANPRWSEDPRFLLQQVRSQLGHEPRPASAGARRSEAEQALRRLPWAARLLAEWLAARARRAAALREEGKSALVAMVLPMRLLLLEMGRRMVDADVIDGPEDVFHLSRMDVETFMRGEWDGSDFRTLVSRRRAAREAQMAGPPPPSLIREDSLGLRLDSTKDERGASQGIAAQGADVATTERVLRGMAAAAGRACGPARLIRHPSEAERLQRGDVLVAPSTDPGWTPLFLRTAAVVTEVGGLLSHGAIVAREYGIPAVVNVSGVLQALHDGEMVCVDGNSGLVERSELP